MAAQNQNKPRNRGLCGACFGGKQPPRDLVPRLPRIEIIEPDMRPRVYVTRQVHEPALQVLNQYCDVNVWYSDRLCPHEELLNHVRNVDGIFCTISDNIDKDVLDAAGPSLKIVATMSVDAHHIDQFECKRRNIEVACVPDSASDAAAEMTCALLLVAARRLLEGEKAVKSGEWGLWKPMWICGIELHERVLGILGMGKVGYGVARRMAPFGISRIIYNDIGQSSFATTIQADFVNLDVLFRQSDFLVVCPVLTEQTKKIINRENLSKMKNTAIVVNASRGKIVDTEALREALQNKTIYAAALDVTDPEPLPASHPLVRMDNCIITPHLGTNTHKTRENMAVNTAKNIVSVLVRDGGVGFQHQGY